MSIERAQQGRVEKHLDKSIRYNGQFMTVRAFLHRLHDEGCRVITREESVLKYNRRKWNNMDAREQDEWTRRAAVKQTNYYAETPTQTQVKLTKIEADYLSSLSC